MRLLPVPRPAADDVTSVPAPRDAGPTEEGAATDGEPVLVEVVGSRSTARLLAAACPPGWRVAPTDAPTHHPCVDLVVLVAPSPARLVEVTGAYRGVDVAVLLDRRAPTEDVVAALEAGATTCLCDAPAELVAQHLVAVRRRRGRRRRS